MTIINERPYIIANWLFLVAAMVLAMAVIGAVTRLTESGLSITEWRPVAGAVPPLSVDDWQGEFTRYQATPEYQKKNLGMTLDEFKRIYFWEWVHRFWGRLIGLAFALPLLVFWLRGWLGARTTWWCFVLLALGGAQGFVGWFMVQSGLIDRPSVSHYRLALHLGCAALLYAGLIALAIHVRGRAMGKRVEGPPAGPWLRAHGVLALLTLATTIVWGAFVAGLDAGLIYNEFPTMGTGRLMPVEMWHMTPAWINLFENHAAVQFTHRCLAAATVLAVLSLSAHALLVDQRGWIFPVLAVLVLCQAGLGIATLLTGVHLHVAVMHQAMGFVLLGAMVVAVHKLFCRSKSA